MLARVLFSLGGFAAGVLVAFAIAAGFERPSEREGKLSKQVDESLATIESYAAQVDRLQEGVAKGNAALEQLIDEKADLESEVEQAQHDLELEKDRVTALENELRLAKRKPLGRFGKGAEALLVATAPYLDVELKPHELQGRPAWRWLSSLGSIDAIGEREDWQQVGYTFAPRLETEELEDLTQRMLAAQAILDEFAPDDPDSAEWVLHAMVALTKAPEGAMIRQRIARADVSLFKMLDLYHLEIEARPDGWRICNAGSRAKKQREKRRASGRASATRAPSAA